MDGKAILILIVGTLLLMGLGAGSAWVSFLSWRRVWRIWQAVTVRPGEVRDLTGQLVKLEGEARPGPGGPVAAPVTGQPCVYWEHKVVEEETEGGGGNDRVRTRRRVLEESRSEQPFLIADERGVIQLLPQAVVFDGIEQTHHSARGGVAEPTIETYERLIPLNHRIYAMGTAAHDGKALASLEHGQATALVSTKSFTALCIRHTIVGAIVAVFSLFFFTMLVIYWLAVLDGARW